MTRLGCYQPSFRTSPLVGRNVFHRGLFSFNPIEDEYACTLDVPDLTCSKTKNQTASHSTALSVLVEYQITSRHSLQCSFVLTRSSLLSKTCIDTTKDPA